MIVGSIHRAEQYRSAISGVEVFALISDRSFPRHAHDHFGVGVLHAGAHRSWSGVGHVEAGAGDVITVNPGEMHDGDPIQGRARSWQMLYFDPGIVAQALREDMRGDAEIAHPALHDPFLADRFTTLFADLTAPISNALAAEEGVLRTVAHLLIRYGSRPSLHPARRRPSPGPFAA